MMELSTLQIRTFFELTLQKTFLWYTHTRINYSQLKLKNEKKLYIQGLSLKFEQNEQFV